VAWLQPEGCLCQASVAAGVGARVGAELLQGGAVLIGAAARTASVAVKRKASGSPGWGTSSVIGIDER
jgi:hypothetical protein